MGCAALMSAGFQRVQCHDILTIFRLQTLSNHCEGTITYYIGINRQERVKNLFYLIKTSGPSRQYWVLAKDFKYPATLLIETTNQNATIGGLEKRGWNKNTRCLHRVTVARRTRLVWRTACQHHDEGMVRGAESTG